MSRVLRRPMFRGGYVDSEGTGITSGLTDNYSQGGRVEFQRGGVSRIPGIDDLSQVGIYNPSFINFAAINPATGLPYTQRDRLNLPPTIEERAEKAGIKLTGIPRAEQIKKLSEFEKEEAAKKLAAAKLLTDKNNQGLISNNEKNITPQKNLTSFFDEYMNMINKANLVNQDEFTKQKYLELAKFGLNLMGQPGGLPGGRRDLFGAISRAAEKPLEGYQNILTRESQMKMLPKQLALQASINAMAPGEVEKTMRTLRRIGVSEEKIKDFLLKENTPQQRIQDQAEMESYKPSLISKFTFLTKKENIKQGLQETAAQSFLNWKKINPNLTLGLISEKPKDKGLAVDKKYYIDPSTGVILQFDKKINDYRDSLSE